MSSIENINNKRPYIAPAVTAVVFRTERGYASSGDWAPHQAANNINEWMGTNMPNIQDWAAGDQVVYGTNTVNQNDNGLAAGYFTFYNTNADEGGWF